MIKEFEFYHGAVLTKIVRYRKDVVALRHFSVESNASYIIDDAIGIYIKHSSKRMSPWHFSFLNGHRIEIIQMQNAFENVFVLLVCGEDGVVTLNTEDLQLVLGNADQVEWLKAKRTPRKEYTIKGSAGTLSYKIGKKDFPRKIFDAKK